MSSELSRKLGLELYREMIEKRLPRNLRIIPYDVLLQGFEGQVPRPLHVLVPAAPNGEPSLIGKPAVPVSQDGEALKRHIQGLPPEYRTVFVLHDVEGLTHRAVAEMLGLSVSASRSRLSRARAALLEAISNDPGLSPPLKMKLDQMMSAGNKG